jgi:hypothetical protein
MIEDETTFKTLAEAFLTHGTDIRLCPQRRCSDDEATGGQEFATPQGVAGSCDQSFAAGAVFYDGSGTTLNLASRIQAPDKPQVKKPPVGSKPSPRLATSAPPTRRSFAHQRIRTKKGWAKATDHY